MKRDKYLIDFPGTFNYVTRQDSTVFYIITNILRVQFFFTISEYIILYQKSNQI